jgi:hypothetical protein
VEPTEAYSSLREDVKECGELYALTQSEYFLDSPWYFGKRDPIPATLSGPEEEVVLELSNDILG